MALFKSRWVILWEREDGDQLQHMCAQGYAWAEDKEHCEEYGRMLSADPTKVSQRAKKRGLPQVSCSDSLHSNPRDHRHPVLSAPCSPFMCVFEPASRYMVRAAQTWDPVQMGTLGAGNHYAEIQVIDKVFDDAAARKMGIDQEGQVRHPAFPQSTRPCMHCLWGFASLLGSASRRYPSLSIRTWAKLFHAPLVDSIVTQGQSAAGVHNDTQRQPRLGAPGGHRRADVHGARHGPRQHPDQRQAAGLRPYQLAGVGSQPAAPSLPEAVVNQRPP